MAGNIRTLLPRILTAAYGIIYFLIMIFSPYSDFSSMENWPWIEYVTVPAAIGIYLLALIFLFFNELVSGVILLFWHLIIWLFVLSIWDVGGINIILAFPILFLAVWLIIDWFFHNDLKKVKGPSKYRLFLRLLLINYSAIYVLVIFFHTVPELIGWELITHIDENTYWNYSSFLGIALILTTILYFIAFYLSWKSELISGLLFIFWYACIIYLTFGFEELLYSGPWFIFSIPILVHGILLVLYHFRFQKRNSVLSHG